MKTGHDALCFLLLGLLFPALFLAFTGSPLWISMWVVAWILLTIVFKPRVRQ